MLSIEIIFSFSTAFDLLTLSSVLHKSSSTSLIKINVQRMEVFYKQMFSKVKTTTSTTQWVDQKAVLLSLSRIFPPLSVLILPRYYSTTPIEDDLVALAYQYWWGVSINFLPQPLNPQHCSTQQKTTATKQDASSPARLKRASLPSLVATTFFLGMPSNVVSKKRYDTVVDSQPPTAEGFQDYVLLPKYFELVFIDSHRRNKIN